MDTLEGMADRTSAALVQIGRRFGRALLADGPDAEGLFKEALDADPK